MLRGNPATQFKKGDPKQVEIARAGAKKSAQVRRERADARRTVQILLGLTIQNGKVYDVEKAKAVPDVKGKNVTLLDSLILKQVERASHGSLDALKFLIEQAGQGAINLDQIAREERADARTQAGLNSMDIEEEEQNTNATLSLLEQLKDVKIEGVDDEPNVESETCQDTSVGS